MTTLTLFLILGYLISYLATPIIRRLAIRINLVDQPNFRKVHHANIPLIGGIVIGVSILLMTPFIIGIVGEVEGWHFTLIGIYTTFLIIGSIDDRFDIAAKHKFGIQIICAIIAVKSSIYFPFMDVILKTECPLWLNQIFNIFLIVGTVNAYNLSDGIDGLSGSFLLFGFSLIGYFGYITGFGFIVLLSTISIGALIVFLKFNLSIKNKIFMGDGGTLSLGFLLISLYIKQMGELSINPNGLSSIQVVLSSILFIPILDSLVVFMRRINRYQSPFKADKKHLHHIVLSITKNHKKSTLIIIGLALFICCCSGLLFSSTNSLWSMTILPILYLLIYFILNRIKLFKRCKLIIAELEN